MGAPRQHIRRKVRIGVRLPANHDEIAGEVAQQNVVLDLRVLCGTSHAETHVPVRGSVKRVPCGLNGAQSESRVDLATLVVRLYLPYRRSSIGKLALELRQYFPVRPRFQILAQQRKETY